MAKAESLPALIYPCEPPYIYIDLPVEVWPLLAFTRMVRGRPADREVRISFEDEERLLQRAAGT